MGITENEMEALVGVHGLGFPKIWGTFLGSL